MEPTVNGTNDSVIESVKCYGNVGECFQVDLDTCC